MEQLDEMLQLCEFCNSKYKIIDLIKIENLFKRVNDCFERSLNGKALAENSPEMQAMIAYIEYIGKNVPKDSTALASGIRDINR